MVNICFCERIRAHFYEVMTIRADQIPPTLIRQDGEMVLLDGGCEYFGYVSDITRTWPVNGK